MKGSGCWWGQRENQVDGKTVDFCSMVMSSKRHDERKQGTALDFCFVGYEPFTSAIYLLNSKRWAGNNISAVFIGLICCLHHWWW